jgi:hypothetical protein
MHKDIHVLVLIGAPHTRVEDGYSVRHDDHHATLPEDQLLSIKHSNTYKCPRIPITDYISIYVPKYPLQRFDVAYKDDVGLYTVTLESGSCSSRDLFMASVEITTDHVQATVLSTLLLGEDDSGKRTVTYLLRSSEDLSTPK